MLEYISATIRKGYLRGGLFVAVRRNSNCEKLGMIEASAKGWHNTYSTARTARSETDGGPGQLENRAEAPLMEWKLGVIVSEKQKSGRGSWMGAGGRTCLELDGVYRVDTVLPSEMYNLEMYNLDGN